VHVSPAGDGWVMSRPVLQWEFSPELLKTQKMKSSTRQQQIGRFINGGFSTRRWACKVRFLNWKMNCKKLGLEYDALESQNTDCKSPGTLSLAGSQMLSLGGSTAKRCWMQIPCSLCTSLGTKESYLWVVTPQKVAVTRIAPRKNY